MASLMFRVAVRRPSSPDRLLLLALFNGATVEFVQLNDTCPTAHQRRYHQPSLCHVFRLNDGPSAVGASFASPVKIPEIPLRIEHLDQIKAFLSCVWRLYQISIHIFLLVQKVDAASLVAHPVTPPRPWQSVPNGHLLPAERRYICASSFECHPAAYQARVAITSRYSACTTVSSSPARLCADHNASSSSRSCLPSVSLSDSNARFVGP